MADVKANAEALVPKFKFERLLNQDQAGRRVTLLGAIDDQPALLVMERAPFPESPDYLASVPATLETIRNLGANDIYHWYLATSGGGKEANTPAPSAVPATTGTGESFPADLKLNLIYPCTAKHVAKYSPQAVRMVVETPAVYRDQVRPYMAAQRGRLAWVYNILEGRTEVEDVIYRTSPPKQQQQEQQGGDDKDENSGNAPSSPSQDFLLLPDLNWDRRTVKALHLLALVERRDLWSLRDLRRRDVPWLRAMRTRLVEATTAAYAASALEPDQLKLYVHYQPTYYHFHVHITHVALEADGGQAVGKGVALDALIGMLENLGHGRGDGDGKEDDEAGMELYTLSYTLGEASDLWKEVFEPLKKQKEEAEKVKGQE